MSDFQCSFLDVLNWTQSEHVLGAKSTLFSGISTDSRTLKTGDLFVALKGPHFDGNNFLKEALEKGASGVLASEALDEEMIHLFRRRGVVLAKAKNGLEAIQILAQNYRRQFLIPMVGLTGSCGKTTTKDMTHAFLEELGPSLKNEGTLNNHLGVPLTLFKLKSDHQTCVLEMGTSSFGEISKHASLALPTLSVVLNIGAAHLKMLKSVEGVLSEKWTLIESESSQLGIYNEDDPLLRQQAKKSSKELWSFGIYEGGMLRASRIEFLKNQTTQFYLIFQGEEVGMVKIPFLGLHQVYNCLAAMLIAHALGVSWNSMIQKALELKLPKMRWEVMRANGIYFINDCYNANPQSVRSALESFQLMSVEGKKFFVFGDMLELGKEEFRLHEELANDVIQSGVDYLVTLGPLSNSLVQMIKKKGFSKPICFSFETHEEIRHCLESLIESSDAVLVKGSRAMGMERIIEGLIGKFQKNHPHSISKL